MAIASKLLTNRRVRQAAVSYSRAPRRPEGPRREIDSESDGALGCRQAIQGPRRARGAPAGSDTAAPPPVEHLEDSVVIAVRLLAEGA